MNLTLTNLHRRRIHRRKWRATVVKLGRVMGRHAARWPGPRLSDLSLVFVDDRRMAALNWRFLRRRGATDVMAFNYAAGDGEIIISLDATARQAKDYGQTFEQELTRYLVHGMLHLAGLDDGQPRSRHRMRIEEQWLLRKLKQPI